MKGFSDMVTQMQGWGLRSNAVCTFFLHVFRIKSIAKLLFCFCVCAFAFLHYSVFSLLVFLWHMMDHIFFIFLACSSVPATLQKIVSEATSELSRPVRCAWGCMAHIEIHVFFCIVFKWPHLQGVVCGVFIRRTCTLSYVVLFPVCLLLLQAFFIALSFFPLRGTVLLVKQKEEAITTFFYIVFVYSFSSVAR